jgi:hypothetical protein
MLLFFEKDGRQIKPTGWGQEGRLDQFLFEFPEVLSAVLFPGEPNRLIPLGRQLWKTDVLYLRLETELDDAALLVCEDKLKGNAELRREVLGQVVDYSSLLTRLPEPEFESKVRASYESAEVKAVIARLVARLPAGDVEPLELDEAVRWACTARREHRIESVICAEQIGDGLARMAHWLNALVAGTVPHPLVSLVDVAPHAGDGTSLVTLAAVFAAAVGVDVQRADAGELQRIRDAARFLADSPMFRADLVSARRSDGGVVSLESHLRDVQPRLVKTSPVQAASVDAWLASVPKPVVRRLYDAIRAGFGEAAAWHPGGMTGAQLVLSMPGRGLPGKAHVLRLKDSSASFVMLGALEREGARDVVAWARQELPSLGVGNADASQPSLDLAALERLDASNFRPIISFISELLRRASV